MAVSPGVGLQAMGEGIGDPGVAVTPQILHTIEWGIASVVMVPSDPYWSSVVLLALNDNKADGTTTFADQSNSAHAITARNSAQYDTSSAPSGMTSSGQFVRASSDYLDTPDHADWDLPGDFTLDFAIRFDSHTASQGILGVINSSAVGAWGSVWNTANIFRVFINNAAVILDFSFTPTNAVWYWVEINRSGNDWRAFVDGTQIGTTLTDTVTLNANTSTLSIGGLTDGINNLDGRLASVRITKGVARHTANFTPPSLPLPTS